MTWYLAIQAAVWAILAFMFLRAQEHPHYVLRTRSRGEIAWSVLVAALLLVQAAWPAWLLYVRYRYTE